MCQGSIARNTLNSSKNAARGHGTRQKNHADVSFLTRMKKTNNKSLEARLRSPGDVQQIVVSGGKD